MGGGTVATLAQRAATVVTMPARAKEKPRISPGSFLEAGEGGRTLDIHVGKVFNPHYSLKNAVWYPPASQKPPQRDTVAGDTLRLTFCIPSSLAIRELEKPARGLPLKSP